MRERIKEARTLRKYSQKALAEKIGISDAALSKIESGVNNPARSTLIAIANALNVDVDWLISGTGEMESPTSSRTLDAVARRYSSSTTFRAMVDAYAQLDEAGQAAIERYVGLLHEAMTVGGDVTKVAVDLSEAELTEQADDMERNDKAQ